MTDTSLVHPASRNVIPGYRAVEVKTGKSRQQIWRDIRAGNFPVPIELGPNSVGWYRDEIDEWLASRPRRTYGSNKIDVEEADVNNRADVKDDKAALSEAKQQIDGEDEEPAIS